MKYLFHENKLRQMRGGSLVLQVRLFSFLIMNSMRNPELKEAPAKTILKEECAKLGIEVQDN
jgi:hypothetical protein